jgi:hypothetical protein
MNSKQPFSKDTQNLINGKQLQGSRIVSGKLLKFIMPRDGKRCSADNISKKAAIQKYQRY